MALSARQTLEILGVAGVVAALLILSGCDSTTTQTKSARIDLQIERKQASMKTTKLTGTAAGVKVVDATAVRAKDAGAIAVVVRNEGDSIVNDLPVGVGVRGADGKPAYLNLGKRVPYFQSHLPAIEPGKQLTFVFSSDKPLPDGTPFAKVGVASTPALAKASSVPGMTVSSPKSSKSKKAQVVEAKVTNDSQIPQYDVEVYASASKGDSVVAAGAAKVGEIAPGQAVTVRVPVSGSLDGAKAEAFAPPTIFD